VPALVEAPNEGVRPLNQVESEAAGTRAHSIELDDQRGDDRPVFSAAVGAGEERLAKIVNGHLNSQIDDLLPWAYAKAEPLKAVA
jgi:hypothetical protein